MSVKLVYSQQLETETCCACGVEFAMPAALRKHFLDDRNLSFYCPNGHKQCYLGETEAQRLQRELNKQVERTRWAEQERAATLEKLKKVERRVSKGVCPCCNRTFVNLQRHMATKHKEFSK